MKRTFVPDYAIYGFNIIMDDDEENKPEEDKTGPLELRNEGWKTIAMPV